MVEEKPCSSTFAWMTGKDDKGKDVHLRTVVCDSTGRHVLHKDSNTGYVWRDK